MKEWFKSGSPWIWLTAGAVALSLLMVAGVLSLTALRGLGHFWPKAVVEMKFEEKDGSKIRLIGEIREQEEVSLRRLTESGFKIETKDLFVTRVLLKMGNRDVTGVDFRWFPEPLLTERAYPKDLLVIERREWGNFYGHLTAVKEGDQVVAAGEAAWPELQKRFKRANDLFNQIYRIEKNDIGDVNYRIEKLRLEERRAQLGGRLTEALKARLAQQREALNTEFAGLQDKLQVLRTEIGRDSVVGEVMDGQMKEVKLALIADVYRPNDMGMLAKTGHYFKKLGEFLKDDPREANTEGGIFPAIFGTVLMVLMMSVIVTPFGIMAAVYMREYAKQGPLIRIIRISVNNLAGVPSIVYGVFGLGFFVYFLGGNIDQLFFAEALPAPTFGSPGILWASLTLAILTLPVVIVSTEEGLSRVPRSLREGSLALGATKAETLWKTVLPMASPAMMTGLILAVARAAGEVAPLMLVGVVKLAPTLPLDGYFPYLHLERKFMHLGFHIYDVGFQSPNVEAARPLVYATALLLVVVIMVLNIFAIRLRNSLREKFRGLESV
ncbi:MAG: phosphate ABC transporter permease PstA [Hydrogenophaga sp.]|jgi:phosphate transport system permease protein|uniref:phosphate ABC transporter permease PstA n=1 Tax=Hydrogenophaga sp. TaxID=1904254 RepID=UPI00271879B2|nr:phosphate ABC transporter permease PstA [Hydrogenophaga sp.]MDO9200705.1 phosphate ABC transporter permease PstA [Hydrogenophaga sp.]MDO9483802.1 phosphate ABC transporter permease PstA [Hydrogenophaga sp.]MDO9569789.1 phosphate ABC transporter permease PstA [Hydrogenophaga sp.]MDP1894900.1 phosphate ABC transporter permease PstA [Hydrogenophaga sp.]MDP2218842.1 phosphate ABC transporter permease PstA [Hydrogenophaga sp.]